MHNAEIVDVLFFDPLQLFGSPALDFVVVQHGDVSAEDVAQRLEYSCENIDLYTRRNSTLPCSTPYSGSKISKFYSP